MQSTITGKLNCEFVKLSSIRLLDDLRDTCADENTLDLLLTCGVPLDPCMQDRISVGIGLAILSFHD
jgi:hypothetical protein